MTFDFLIIAGAFSLLAAALHIGVVIGGPRWYIFFGAGQKMARMAENGSLRPAVATFGLAAVLTLWGTYAWSGAGLLPNMLFTKLALTVVTAIYLIRGIGGLIAPFVTNHASIQQNSRAFWFWSSLICLMIGALHLMGILAAWSTL
ncbi:MAG: putative oxidoreductase [Oceanospirillaceae bacterium]|jgi:putative oxidoreductase